MHNYKENWMNEDAKVFLDSGAIGAIVANIFNVIPHIPAILAAVYLSLRIYGLMMKYGFIRSRTLRTREDDKDDS